MKRIFSIICPLLFIYFAGCGGGDSSSPAPLASDPTTPPQVACADTALSTAIQKCQSNIAPLIPLLLQNNQNGSSNDNTPLLLAALSASQNQQQPTPVPTPIPSGTPNPSCSTPAQPDPSTSCHDDLTTALLLWKSAHYNNPSDPACANPSTANSDPNCLAINNPTYKQYLVQRLASVLTQVGAQYGVQPGTPQANGLLGTLGSTVLNSGLLNQSGLPPQQVTGIQNLIQSNLANPSLGGLGGISAGSNFGLSAAPSGLNPNGLGGFPIAGGGNRLFSGQQQLNDSNAQSLGITSQSELMKARGIGLPSSTISVRPSNNP